LIDFDALGSVLNQEHQTRTGNTSAGNAITATMLRK